MATATGPDLKPAQRAVERLMDDTCVITRNPAGTDDAVLNQVTGLLEDPATLAPVYKGKCAISPSSSTVQGVRTEGGVSFEHETLTIKLPITCPQLLEGDVVKMTSSRRDPQLNGQEFRVTHVVYSTMSVSRKAFVGARR